MDTKPADFALPKITPPRPARLYPRQRLFELFDRSREMHGLIWVSAPAGAGKTSLAASYLALRALPTLWYQVDAGDGDIASFFFYLGLATARIAPQHEQPMPVLKPEYLGDLPTFARNYFREFFRRLPQHCIVVFDNFQNAPLDSPLRELLPVMLHEQPRGLGLVVLSREDPPATLARLRLCDEMSCVDAAQLQLTAEESQGVSAARLGDAQPDHAMLSQLHERTQGWVAGLVLLLEQTRTGSTLNPSQIPAGQALLFDYFAGEVFARFTAAEQDFLRKTALFAKVPVPAARELSGNPQAAAILDDLTRRNYFTVRHAASYEYHPLFREFLLNRLAAQAEECELRALQQQAAQLLVDAGLIDDAVELFVAAGAWEALTPIVLQQAAGLIAQGRAQVLARWIAAIPPALREHEPWLDYWLGVSRFAYNTVEARLSLERAHRGFTSRQDRAGLLLCWAGIGETLILEFDDLTRLEPWIKWLTDELKANPEFPSVAVELQVVSVMALVMLFCRDESAVVRPWIDRATVAIGLIPDLGVRCRLATCLALHATWSGDLGRLAVIAGQARQWSDTLAAGGRSGIDAQYALYCQTLHQWTAGSGDFGRAASAGALAHAARTGIHAIEHHLVARGLTASLCQGDLEAARAGLCRLHALAANHKSPRLHLFQYHNLPGWLSLVAGNNPQALNEAQESLRISQVSGATVFHRACSHLVAGHALALMRRCDEAQRHIDHALTLARRFDSPFLEFSALLLQSFTETLRAEIDGRAPDLAGLHHALALGRQHGYLNTAVWLPESVITLCCVALEQGIEPVYVQALIFARNLAPAAPPVHLENWPWPLRVYTLGRFSIVRDGLPLAITLGKGHKKPLEMLKTLIALGGRQVGVEHLIEQLWPDAEGDAGANLFKITLHRLRKLLGHDNAVEFAEGRLSLNAKMVWVDSWSLARVLGQAPGAETVNRALALYRGRFLELEPANNSAIVRYREQLSGRVVGALKLQIDSCESRQEWESVLNISTRALTLDDHDEDFHCAAIRAHLARGRRAEALRAFEHAKQRYAQLHLKPSPRLLALIAD
jgi:ATP/maltotriose-dependent transcriptional regulator MalT/DNA-binding SARP family transcriptional activator